MIPHGLNAIRHRLRRAASDESRQTGRDLSLARRLYATFERDLKLAEIQGIHFYVQNGVVTLYGTVRTDLDRELLVSLVREIPGVKGVVAHLQLVDSRFQETADVNDDLDLG